jgi:hypothetical protein
MVSPDYPEIFSRESFQAYADGVSNWRQLKTAVMRWQQYPLSHLQEQSLRFYAPLMGVYSQVDKTFKETGLKVTQDKRGRFIIRDSKGHFAKAGERSKTHHKKEE